MRFTALCCLSLLLLGSAAVFGAADINGKWTADTLLGAGGGELPEPTTFIFKVEDGKLTGTVSTPRGDFEIRDGKVEENSVLFHIVMGGNTKILYDGRIEEDGIDFIAKFEGRDRSNHFVARRVPS